MSSVLEVKEKCRLILTDTQGSVEMDKDGDFVLRRGSAIAFVRVEPLVDSDEDQGTLIQVFSILLTGVPATPELFKHVALRSSDFRFGHLSCREDDDGTVRIMIKHRLLGDYLDPEELKWAVFAPLGSADALDDELQGLFGGKKFTE